VYTVGCQECLTLFVVLYACSLIVLPAVQLDAEFVLVAIKVEDIGSYRILTTKLQTTELTATQTVPQEFFCVSLLTSQLAHKSEVFWGESDFHGDPHPSPLPLGEGTQGLS